MIFEKSKTACELFDHVSVISIVSSLKFLSSNVIEQPIQLYSHSI